MAVFAFQSNYQASAFLAEEALPEELIYVKASITDHLERIMLSQLDQVVCWRERCRRRDVDCPSCRNYRRPHAPPFGLAESNSLVAARLPQKHSDVDSAASARAASTGSPARNTL